MYLRSLTQLRRARSRIFVTLTFSYHPPVKKKTNTREKKRKGGRKEKDTHPLLSDFHFDSTFFSVQDATANKHLGKIYTNGVHIVSWVFTVNSDQNTCVIVFFSFFKFFFFFLPRFLIVVEITLSWIGGRRASKRRSCLDTVTKTH